MICGRREYDRRTWFVWLHNTCHRSAGTKVGPYSLSHEEQNRNKHIEGFIMHVVAILS
jgi:hypothetical protein